ncbi:unnamed protein product [Rhizophagus irregularis]|nr:unnamed protein product [Rhizophagus irregularis]
MSNIEFVTQQNQQHAHIIVQLPTEQGASAVYYQYNQSKIISMSNSTWNDFHGLFNCLKQLFGLRGSMLDYDFIIANKRADFAVSKENFIKFIEDNKNSSDNPVRIIDAKGPQMTYVEILDSLPTPSKLGEPEKWNNINCNKAVCLNHRPPSASSAVPVSLYCPIFGTFEDRCEEDPERDDNIFTYKFCLEMAKFYSKEEYRRETANRLLSAYLDHKVEPIILPGNRSTDGTVSTNELYREINIEYKNESCSTNSCAHLENCGYYLSFCSKQENTDTNMPCILVNIAGPTFAVYGAVLSSTAIVDPLTPIFHLIWLKNNEKMMLALSRTFRALRLSLQDLDNYYENVPKTHHRLYPLFPDWRLDLNTLYKVRINSQYGNYLLWKATLQSNNTVDWLIYVKAVQKKYYSLEVHEYLVDTGNAPIILNTVEWPGGWLLVYMECLENHVTLNKITHNLDNNERDSLRNEIIRVVRILHDKNLVHGDLREGNILVGRDNEKDSGFDVKLIDFEWSGPVNTARYSHFMNHIAINWPEGAEDGKLVMKEHDIAMLEQTFRETNLLTN